MSPISKLILGIIVTVAICALFPILDLLQQFVVIVCIPLIFLVAIGLVSDSTYTMIKDGAGFKQWVASLRDRIDVYREELEDAKEL